MRRLGEAASDVPGGWYSPKSTPPRKERTEEKRGRSHSREKLNAGLILLAIQSHRFSPSASILFRTLRSLPFRTDKRTPFFLSFPLIAESETQATVIPLLSRLSFSFPALYLSDSPLFPPLLPPSSLLLFSPRRLLVFFFSYWHRFHKYSMAGDVPRDCKTSGRFRLCGGLCAFELDMAKVDVSLARSPEYP